jgi:hypothetical protein
MTHGSTRSQLRAADTDRDAVAEHLAVAMSEGRLGADEYDQRLEQAYAATTYAELDRLVADLPTPTQQDPATSPRSAKHRATTLEATDDVRWITGCPISCVIFVVVMIVANLA